MHKIPYRYLFYVLAYPMKCQLEINKVMSIVSIPVCDG